jgi:hypothetical protein
MPFVAGLVLGLALGLIVIGFLAIAAYQRGIEEATGKRKVWRAELVARRAAVRAMPAVTLKKAS